MFDKLKANILFHQLLKRPNIDKAYAMVGPEDSWYDTISTVHRSLEEIQRLPHENWQITSHDGLTLHGIFYPAESNKTMIWVHGYTSHAERESAYPALFYRSLGFNVLIPYLRAHGPSEGKYISLGALERLDMLQWVEQVNRSIPQSQIVIHGLSMGGGIVLDLATQEMENVKCLVCDAPSVSIQAMFHDITKAVFKKSYNKVLPCIEQRFEDTFLVSCEKFDRIKNISTARYPMLLSAGSNENMDTVLIQLQARSPKDTSVVILPGCNHGNGMYKQTQMYQTAIKELLNKSFDV